MAETSANGAPAKAPLDEVMLAMDVVDTLRQRQTLVERELNEEGREAQLVARLRKIYAAQGMQVPDKVLREGVEALKRDRFVYASPKPGLSVWLARAYVRRGTIGKAVAVVALLIIAGLAGYKFLVVDPAQRRATAAFVELQETLPNTLTALRKSIATLAREPEVKARAETLYTQGAAAAAEGRAEAARGAVAALQKLADILRQDYEVRIVTDPGVRSGIWRVPDANSGARNYYLIVEAATSAGKLLELPVLSEETGKTKQVSRWGVRVSAPVFEAVRADKTDDGIIQNRTVAVKPPGYTKLDYKMPVAGGAITDW